MKPSSSGKNLVDCRFINVRFLYNDNANAVFKLYEAGGRARIYFTDR